MLNLNVTIKLPFVADCNVERLTNNPWAIDAWRDGGEIFLAVGKWRVIATPLGVGATLGGRKRDYETSRTGNRCKCSGGAD